MMPSRRMLLAALATLPALPSARAQTGSAPIPAVQPALAADDPRAADRVAGSADAKVTVQEYFSLTCTHCADFQKQTFPRVKTELIDTGKIRYIWRDYPLDQLALYAAMIARTLPAERYEPFVSALLTTQNRWAFTRSANPMDELLKLATLAGMSRDTYDKTVRDTALQQFILAEQAEGEKKYSVASTPTFIVNEKPLPGAITYDAFAQAVEAASAA